jgi:hypothetical protein
MRGFAWGWATRWRRSDSLRLVGRRSGSIPGVGARELGSDFGVDSSRCVDEGDACCGGGVERDEGGGDGVRIADRTAGSDDVDAVFVDSSSCFRELLVENARMDSSRCCCRYARDVDLEHEIGRDIRVIDLEFACCDISCAMIVAAVCGRHARMRLDAEEVAISAICLLRACQ